MIKQIYNLTVNLMALFIINRKKRHQFRAKYKKYDLVKRKVKKLIFKPDLFFYDFFRKRLNISDIYMTYDQIQVARRHSVYSGRFLNFIENNKEYYGIKRFCNICGFRFSKFENYSSVKPREAKCPVCGSLERHRHLYILIQSIYPFLENKKILHFAPEQLFKNIFTKSKCDYFDADLEPHAASYQVDMTDMQFEDSTFDYIIAVHVLEHIPDDKKAMSELYRVLKRGGGGIFSGSAKTGI